MTKQKAPNITGLVIDKDDFVKASLDFLGHYGRLPYMKEDEVLLTIEEEVINGEGLKETRELDRYYTSLKYVKGHFGSPEEMTQYLLDEDKLTFARIAELITIPEKRVKELYSGDATKVETHERRMIELFFNDDLYADLGHGLSKHCSDCTKSKQCGQPYWVSVISCPKFKKKKAAKK